MGFGIHCYNIGKKEFFEMHYNILDPNLVEDDYLDEAIDFAHDLLFSPAFYDGHLDREVLKEIKMRMINSMGSRLKDPSFKANNEVFLKVFPNSFLSKDIVLSKEEYADILNSFTDSDIINMYEHLIDNCFVGAQFMGNINEKDLEKISSSFKFKTLAEVDTDYNEKFEIVLDDRDIVTPNPLSSESTLVELFSIENYQFSDQYAFIALEMILNYVGLILHKTLREELKLVYSASASFNRRIGFMTVKASIDKANKDKTLNGIDKALSTLENRDYVNELLDSVKREIYLDIYTEDESENRVFGRYLDEKFEWRERQDIVKKSYQSLTAKDIIDAVHRLKKEGTFLLRGDK